MLGEPAQGSVQVLLALGRGGAGEGAPEEGVQTV